jgi:hypothetical protein
MIRRRDRGCAERAAADESVSGRPDWPCRASSNPKRYIITNSVPCGKQMFLICSKRLLHNLHKYDKVCIEKKKEMMSWPISSA